MNIQFGNVSKIASLDCNPDTGDYKIRTEYFDNAKHDVYAIEFSNCMTLISFRLLSLL